MKNRKPTKAKRICDLKRQSTSLSLNELRKIIRYDHRGIIAIGHEFTRAYCVAKPGTRCAVFAVPTCDLEPNNYNDKSLIVHNDTAMNVETGEWCALAFISREDGSGEMHVVHNYDACLLVDIEC